MMVEIYHTIDGGPYYTVDGHSHYDADFFNDERYMFVLFIGGRTKTWGFKLSPSIKIYNRTISNQADRIQITLMSADDRLNIELPRKAYYKGNIMSSNKSYETIPVRHQFQPYKVGEPSKLSQ